MNTTVKPVILSGGSGTRLWPLSRQLYPKQLLPLVGDKTLLQDTIIRLENFPNISDTVTVICNDAHRFLVAEQLREIDVKADALLLEPVGRNTAPALTLAAIANRELGNDDVLLVMPADHVIRDNESFQKALNEGAQLAEQGYLVTFGIVPDRPETGYGYIEQGKEIDKNLSYAINRFVEKPELELAKEYLDSGNFLWNSGKFMIKSSVWLAQIGHYAPQILATCEQAYQNGKSEMDFYRIDEEAFSQCPSDSIDYAVAEKIVADDEDKSIKAAVIPLDAGWSDIGAWAELWKIGKKDSAGNVIQGDVVALDSENSMLFSQQRLIAAVGLKDTVVIETADAILVADRDKVQDVKRVVDWIKSEGREEHLNHRCVFRPWGNYDSIDMGERYHVKRITVDPGGILSLQMHQHRAEHWIVVSGTAKVTRDNETFMLTENESTYIPVGTRHRLENTGSIPLEMIEVQSGSYFGEDDITRYEDVYGR
ncbi:MAG: mannose-1-phosphate guanylyltransferase/mannose-6-phosphate isomerase [Gammaproteobacteria bacterium]|nr:mannose-1-phosphate guanylyltransferase/mannose-6-phosphate isomerase [Gammaproteobacteria bacterium]